jgi:dipeptidyl aminopeptidase/acylaminoacyl peptidase
MNADGSNPVRLTTDAEFDAYPEWSPDGQHIAFRSDRAGNLEVYVMAADGSGQFNWTTNPAADCHPRWTAATVSARQAAAPRGAASAQVVTADRAALAGSSLHPGSPDSCLDQ